MIKGFKIKKEKDVEVLYIELEFNYEFAKFTKSTKKNIKKEIKDFLIKNNIFFKGVIVLTSLGFVIGRIDTKSLDYDKTYFDKNILEYVNQIYVSENENNNSLILEKTEEKEEKKDEDKIIEHKQNENKIQKDESSLIKENKNNNINGNINDKTLQNQNDEVINSESKVNISNDNTLKNDNSDNNENEILNKDEKGENEKQSEIYVTVKSKDGLIKIELEEYVVGVVAGEMPASFNIETLKAMSILARTYALKSIKYGKVLTTDERTQTYKTIDEMKKMWSDSFDKYYNKIKNATQSTKGEYLWYDNDYIEALYHSTSNGKTEDSTEVWGNFYPYLVSVDSTYDDINKTFNYEKVMSYDDVSSSLKMEVDINTNFNVVSYTNSGRVKEININGKIFKGTEIRNLLSLRSTDFSFEKKSDSLLIRTKGYGHGVGLSEWGAEGLARCGYSYTEIINHYYKNIEFKKIRKFLN